MNGLKELLDLLQSKYPNEIPIGREYDLDSFRIKQGQQDVIRTVRNYISKLEHEAKAKK